VLKTAFSVPRRRFGYGPSVPACLEYISLFSKWPSIFLKPIALLAFSPVLSNSSEHLSLPSTCPMSSSTLVVHCSPRYSCLPFNYSLVCHSLLPSNPKGRITLVANVKIKLLSAFICLYTDVRKFVAAVKRFQFFSIFFFFFFAGTTSGLEDKKRKRSS